MKNTSMASREVLEREGIRGGRTVEKHEVEPYKSLRLGSKHTFEKKEEPGKKRQTGRPRKPPNTKTNSTEG